MKIHMVKKGDTLYEIANKYNVELDKLIAMNPQIADPNVIDVGMKVKIPNAPKPVEPPTDYLYKHIVVQGDTLWKLGKAWNVPLNEMIEANSQLKNPNVLMTGEVVYIPKAKTPSNAQHEHQQHHLHQQHHEQHHQQPHGHHGHPKAEPAIPTPAPAEVIEAPQQAPAPAPVPVPVMEEPAAPVMPISEVQPPVAPMPAAQPEMQMPEEPYHNLFQQMHVPATEVFSFDYESWTIPQMPTFQEMPEVTSMPYHEFDCPPQPALFMPTQQLNYNDCGCGGPVSPAFEQAMPFQHGFPIAEHPAFMHAGHGYSAPFPGLQNPLMEGPCYPMPYDTMAMTQAFPGPMFPYHPYQGLPSFESPFGAAPMQMHNGCNCGCHDRSNEIKQPEQASDSKVVISRNTDKAQTAEKAKVKSAKSNKSSNSTEAALRKLVQKNRRKSSSRGRYQQSPWINV